MEKKIKYMYLLCRETISEEINCGFIDNYNQSLHANFSILETFDFMRSSFQR